MATASTAPAPKEYKEYNSYKNKWKLIPLTSKRIVSFRVKKIASISYSENFVFPRKSDTYNHFPYVTFSPTVTRTYKLMKNNYYSCIETPKENCQWSMYVDSEGNFYSYYGFPGDSWYSTKLEIQILEPEL